MRPKCARGATVIGIGLALLLISPGAGAQSAADILKKADQVGYARTTEIELTQTVITPSGDSRTFEMVSYSARGNEKALTEYRSPNQVRGMKILTLGDGDDIWVYFPRTNRVRKIASSARNRRVQGSDFTYDDMAAGKMATNWQGRLAGSETIDGQDCYKLALKPTASGPKTYSRVLAWVRKSDYATLRIDYYDLDGDLEKRLAISGYQKISKVLIPFNYMMINLVDGGKTVMEVKKAKVNSPQRSGLFTEAGLRK